MDDGSRRRLTRRTCGLSGSHVRAKMNGRRREDDVNPMNAEANFRSVRITCEVGAPIERLRTCAPKR
ncbi:MAG: hypothetical protein ACTS4T_01160 [Candidatus Hodgkinia cicadicola]